jgi:hypothetical protein
MPPGKRGVLGDAKPACGLAHGEAFRHTQAEVEPEIAAAYAMEHAACEVREVEGAILALVALGRASLAIADYPEAPAAGAFWAAGHERVADFADV